MTFTSFADLKRSIPIGWSLVRNRSVYEERKESNGGANHELLSVTQNRGVIRQLDYEVKKDGSNEDKSKYKVVHKGDIVYNKMRMWQGAVGLSSFRGIVSPAYIVLTPKNGIVPDYLYLQMKTREYISQSYSQSYGLCDDMNSLRYEDFRSMFTILPPLKTQVSIVNFLNAKLEKIDLFISNKHSYINALKEHKEFMINDIITKGIDSKEKTKFTSDWLPPSPEKWQVKRLKYLVKLRSENPKLSAGAASKIALENIEGFTGRYIKTESPFEGDATLFRKGDVLFGKLRPYLAKVYVAEFDGQCVSDILPLVVDSNQVERKFIFYRLISRDFINEVNSSTYGTKMPRANWGFIGNLAIPYPDKKTQARIVVSIEKEVMTTNGSINKAQKQIELIKEYRNSLVTHAVTGQLKIKG